MSKFKAGDKVIRTEESMFLSKGGGYIVDSVNNSGMLAIIGYKGLLFDSDKFKLLEDTSKHHKHHDLIIAWAKGAEIEVRAGTQSIWFTEKNPIWGEGTEYRIKPTNPEADKLNKLISDMEQQLTDAKKRLKEIASE